MKYVEKKYKLKLPDGKICEKLPKNIADTMIKLVTFSLKLGKGKKKAEKEIEKQQE